MMDRRGFLGTLLASVGALTIDPATLLWQPPAVSDGHPLLKPDAMVGLAAMTQQIHREILTQWQGTVVQKRRIGEDGLTRQFYVTAEMPTEVDHNGLDYERWVRPVGLLLARRLREINAKRTGVLPIDLHGAQVAVAMTPELSVRGICQYYVGFDQSLVRFDVVCG